MQLVERCGLRGWAHRLQNNCGADLGELPFPAPLFQPGHFLALQVACPAGHHSAAYLPTLSGYVVAWLTSFSRGSL